MTYQPHACPNPRCHGILLFEEKIYVEPNGRIMDVYRCSRCWQTVSREADTLDTISVTDDEDTQELYPVYATESEDV